MLKAVSGVITIGFVGTAFDISLPTITSTSEPSTSFFILVGFRSAIKIGPLLIS